MFFILAFLNAGSSIAVFFTSPGSVGMNTLAGINLVIALTMLIWGVIEYYTKSRDE